MMTVKAQKPDDVLAHFGVKGMKWGVRKQKNNSPESSKSERRDFSLKNPKVRRAAIVGTAAVAIFAGAYIASKSGMKVKDLPEASIKSGMAKAKEIFDQPTDVIYLSKAHRGSGVTQGGLEKTTLNFISKGNTKHFFQVFDEAGLNSDNAPPFKKLANGDVAAIFSDLLGRVDSAGRSVPHAVLIPASKAIGLNSIEDVISKYGPDLESRYQRYIREAVRNST